MIALVEPQRGMTTLVSAARGRVHVPLGFDPDVVWGATSAHHVRGRVKGMPVRGVVQRLADGHALRLGPAWVRDCGVAPGDSAEVVLEPEGPQRDDLAKDLAAALEANPAAGAFFDSLTQFYRRGYLRWIDATRRRPERRAERLAEVVALLEAGIKERPKQ
jgi:hypothetical protein